MQSRLAGAVIVPLLVLGAIACAAVPLLAGIVVTALVPGLGGLKVESGWSILHLLWIYALLYVLELIGEPIGKVLIGKGTPAVLVHILGAALAWLALTAMFTVYFEHPAGAGVSALIGLGVLLLVGRRFERDAKSGNDGIPAGSGEH